MKWRTPKCQSGHAGRKIKLVNAVSSNGDAHRNGGDIHSLLSNEPSARKDPVRCLHEPYDRHRANDLRVKCYRRGIRPIKKGPDANDNKNGYIQLLRQIDASIQNLQGRDETGTTRVRAAIMGMKSRSLRI
ncbi:hypothetical protein PsorP6_007503 [Peronosclerospora sorghi]|uniref:Uncharacterized protein n=1 Tax=Peronosclerospora sorghi TaxID=230839 RepID=A0ACC0WAJ1_9STRA|nr:hypothetical protein PsorP6_007503 [Peronosclerospora sorghi]